MSPLTMAEACASVSISSMKDLAILTVVRGRARSSARVEYAVP